MTEMFLWMDEGPIRLTDGRYMSIRSSRVSQTLHYYYEITSVAKPINIYVYSSTMRF